MSNAAFLMGKYQRVIIFLKRTGKAENVMQEEKILVTRSSMPPYEEYIEAIKPLWDSHWLTNMGRYHKELEERLTQYLSVSELSLMVNGHMALELTIQAFGFPEGSEVITTPFTFISTTHAIIRNRLQPVFCDVKLSDGTIDETKIEDLITEKTVAIVPVHVYGNVCNVEEIQRIANKYDLKVIYDAAHAFGVKYKGKGIGNYGDASIFSFHATKVFNTIEGGAVAFANHELYEKLYNLKNFGIQGEELVTDIGANAKMNEFSAIMGLCNLGHVEEVLAERETKYKYYRKKLENITGLSFWDKNQNATENFAYVPVFIQKEYGKTRNELYDELRTHGIYARKYFYPITADQDCFHNQYKNVMLDNARKLSEKVLVLPFYEEITKKQMDIIVDAVKG